MTGDPRPGTSADAISHGGRRRGGRKDHDGNGNSNPVAGSLLKPVRLRSLTITWLLALPLVLAACAVAWRIAGTPAALTIALAGLAAGTAFAWQRQRRYDQSWLVRSLDTQRRDLDDSADLLFANPATLNPLQQLQRGRIAGRLQQTPGPDLRPAWPRSALFIAWVAGLALVIAALAWPQRPPTPAATTGATQPQSALPGQPRLTSQRLRILPPAYTGLPMREVDGFDASAPEGSRLQWTLRYQPQPGGAALEFHQGQRLDLQREGDDWTASHVPQASTLYRVLIDAQDADAAPQLHRIDVIADTPPRIRVRVPGQSLVIATSGQQRWALQFEAEDDHGVAASAQLRVTLAQGEGENITFREQTLAVRGTGETRRKRFAVQLDLAGLGFGVGDDLVAQLTVADNRQPAPHSVRGPSVILRWPSSVAGDATGLEGLARKILPAYFRSQRQIIIDAEALLEERPRLASETFVQRSDAIGVDQRLLRLRYGQFLGEETEGPRPLPTNDALPVVDAAHDGHDDHAHDAAGAAATEAPGAHDGHDHGAHQTAPVPAFGSEVGLLEEWGHMHDIPEAATLLDPETRETLRQALNEMWQSELNLRQGEPRLALPYAYRALEFIKQVQQAERIYLARVGPDLPPIDLARRLRGDREGIARRVLPAAAAIEADGIAAAAWRGLAQAPIVPAQAAAELDALENWLTTNQARVPDPLAFVAAIDAARRDPACNQCRADLRALLWTALARPPAAVLRRPAVDTDGQRYLEALQEAAP